MRWRPILKISPKILLPERWQAPLGRVQFKLAKLAAKRPWLVALIAGFPALVIGLLALGYTESIYWGLPWFPLVVWLGWLGFTTVPVFEEKNPVPRQRRRVRDGRLMMMELPGGEFMMGSPNGDDIADDDEKPRHWVTVSGFRMAVTPVTVALYCEIMGGNPPPDAEAQQPVVDVSWYDAIRFCNALSKKEKYKPCYRIIFGRWICDWRADGYRLPTEAEWEYACRAGAKTRYSFGNDPEHLDAYAWYSGNTNSLQPVGMKRPNRWGLHDMHGNVWEWCWDEYGPYSERPQKNPRGLLKLRRSERRVLRGGSFGNPPERLRSAIRSFDEVRDRNFGFRCIRVVPPQL